MATAVPESQTVPVASSTAAHYGATVRIDTRGQTLALVVARTDAATIVGGVGGQVVARISLQAALAVLELTDVIGLHAHPDVVLAGPVSLDDARFTRFLQTLGVTPHP